MRRDNGDGDTVSKNYTNSKVTGLDLHEALTFKAANAWISHRATAITCAREQIRTASPAEKEMRDVVMRLGAEDPDSRKTHGPSPRRLVLNGYQTANCGDVTVVCGEETTTAIHATDKRATEKATTITIHK